MGTDLLISLRMTGPKGGIGPESVQPLSGASMELRDYLKVLRTRWRLIGLSVAAVTLAALVLSGVQKPSFEGIAKVVLTQQDTGLMMLGIPQPEVSYQPGRDEVETQVEVIRSERIANQAKDALGLSESVDSLLSRVSVTADTGTSLITIRATAPSADRAADTANAFAEAYILWSREDQRASIKAAADDVDKRLSEAQEQMVNLEEAALDPGATVADRARLEVARSQFTSLADRLEELRIAEQLSMGRGSLLATATANSERVSPIHSRNAMLGATIGLLVGLGFAFGADHLDTRVKSAREVADICHAPLLATIPLVPVGKGQSLKLALAHRSNGPDAEAYRMLRSNLSFIYSDDAVKTVLITSAAPSEGKSTVAANLAAALSRAGSTVLLVACDFRLPAVERMFGLTPQAGLSELLTGESALRMPPQQPEGFENLWIMSAGAIPPDPSELLGSEGMGSLVAELGASADWVIFDSAPVLATADAGALARWVDGILFVARVGSSRRDDLRAACDQLTNVGARVLGLAVMGPMDEHEANRYYGYYTKSREGS
jgi:receptor protein-tyrosine kinase